MQKIKKNYISITLLIVLFIAFIAPSKFLLDVGAYHFGYPFSFITVYQHEPTSIWLGANLFTGNKGLSINLLALAGNIILIYLLIAVLGNKLKKKTLV